MIFPLSYTQELENLITSTLLPIYEKYHKAEGVVDPLKGIDPKLLEQVKSKKKIPALLMKK